MIPCECPECDYAYEVPDELLGQSVRCPDCNKRFKVRWSAPVVSRPFPWKVFFGIAAIAGLVIAVLLLAIFNRPDTQRYDRSTAIRLSASDLARQFQSYLASGNRLVSGPHHGKLVELTGTVKQVDWAYGSDDSQMCISLEEGIDCYFSAKHFVGWKPEELADFQKGNRVTVLGRCEIVFLLEIKDCELVR